ncbi:AAEL014300-PA [Aedes aegypti]|uniref:AAEL014300-PA n=1 Tax=Aedes aegypti TaxID=7159 RepID=Q16GQ6_AEDAE|nr:AAEL014300-PA [Aedes aegypti]
MGAYLCGEISTNQSAAGPHDGQLNRALRSPEDIKAETDSGNPCGENCIHRSLYNMCICVTCPEGSRICAMKSHSISVK